MASTEGFKVFEQAIENVKPALEVKSRRVGGSTYQVPIEVRGPRKLSLAMRWILGFARARKEKTFALRLAGELGDAAKGLGSAIKKRDDVHRMAEANKRLLPLPLVRRSGARPFALHKLFS